MKNKIEVESSIFDRREVEANKVRLWYGENLGEYIEVKPVEGGVEVRIGGGRFLSINPYDAGNVLITERRKS